MLVLPVLVVLLVLPGRGTGVLTSIVGFGRAGERDSGGIVLRDRLAKYEPAPTVVVPLLLLLTVVIVGSTVSAGAVT
jgi:hypothetical protein